MVCDEKSQSGSHGADRLLPALREKHAKDGGTLFRGCASGRLGQPPSQVSKTPRAQPAGTLKMGRYALPHIRKKRECVGHPRRLRDVQCGRGRKIRTRVSGNQLIRAPGFDTVALAVQARIAGAASRIQGGIVAWDVSRGSCVEVRRKYCRAAYVDCATGSHRLHYKGLGRGAA